MNVGRHRYELVGTWYLMGYIINANLNKYVYIIFSLIKNNLLVKKKIAVQSYLWAIYNMKNNSPTFVECILLENMFLYMNILKFLF